MPIVRSGSWIDPAVAGYARDHSRQPDDVQRSLIAETAALGSVSGMQIGSDQGAFMTMLVQITGARFIVEIGTFTGYSSLAMARGLPDGGRLLCCDVSEEWTAIARRHWEMAGVSDRIELRIAPALDTLNSLPADPLIDMAFIDADKTSYLAYYEALIPRMGSGAILVIDNTIWSGRVVSEPADGDNDTAALIGLNDRVAADERVDAVLLTIGDGVTLIRKRWPPS